MELSIIIPVFNTEKYLKKCLTTLKFSLANSELDYEIIVVNDCSPGNPQEIIDEFKSCLNIKIFNHKKNKGLFHARLTGFRKAKGKYLTTVDSDDFVVNVIYAKIIGYMDSQGVDVVKIPFVFGMTDEKMVLNFVKYLKQTNTLISGNEKIWSWFTSTPGHWNIWNCIFKKELLDRYINSPFFDRRYINLAEDFLYSSLIMNEAQVMYVSGDYGCYYYRFNPSSICGQIRLSRRKVESDLQSYMNVREIFLEIIPSDLRKKNLDDLFSTNIAPYLLRIEDKLRFEFKPMFEKSFNRKHVNDCFDMFRWKDKFSLKQIVMVYKFCLRRVLKILCPVMSRRRFVLWFVCKSIKKEFL